MNNELQTDSENKHKEPIRRSSHEVHYVFTVSGRSSIDHLL